MQVYVNIILSIVIGISTGSFDALERLLEYVKYGNILPFYLYKADYAAKKV